MNDNKWSGLRWLAALLAVTSFGVPSAAGGDPAGVLLGEPLNPAVFPAQLTAATTDPAGEAVIAWIQREPVQGQEATDHLHAARWDGTRWQALGGVINEDLRHNASRLMAQTGPDGQPWLSWAEDAGTAHVDSVLISGWDGLHWGNPSRYAIRRNFSDAGKSSAFAVQSNGLPFVVWTNIYFPGAFADVVQPFSWLGAVWKTDAPPLNVTLKDSAFFPAAAAAKDGTLYAAWLEGDVAHSDVRVARQQPGGAWTLLGGALNARPDTYTFAPRMRLDPQGRPVLAWLEDQGGIDNVFVKRWDGQNWTSLGGSLNIDPKTPADRPALALDAQGNPLVSWSEGLDGVGQVFARRWTGKGWTLLGGGPLNLHKQPADAPSITVDREGAAVVAWREGPSNQAQVYVKRFAQQAP